MRVALVFLCVLAIASAAVTKQHHGKVADKEYLEKEKAVLELVWRYYQPVYFPDIQETGKNYDINANAANYQNVDVVKTFLKHYNEGFLPKGDNFSPVYDHHLQEVTYLYKLFMNAKDWKTFYQTAAWARVHLNSGVFIYAFSAAVMHRPDTQGLILPPSYELYPYLFLDNTVIQQAYRIRMQQSNNQQTPKGTTKVIYVNSTYFYPHYYYEDEAPRSDMYQYSGDYMRKYHPEARVSYFREDPALNQWHTWMNLENARFVNGSDARRGERFYHDYQQLLARYYLARLSNDLQDIEYLQWDKPIKHGYAPNLRYPNGQEVPVRPDHAVPSKPRYYDIEIVQNFERRISDAIDLGFVYTEDGTKINLYEKNGIEILGNIIQHTADSVHPRFYGKVFQLSLRILGHLYDVKHQHDVAYGTLEHYSTALRDPLFYNLIHRINKLYLRYKNNLPSYTRKQLEYPGLKIESVEVDKLTTFFEQFDIDVTAATAVNTVQDDQNMQILARQYRLNHKPFNYKINVVSDKPGDVWVRAFIGPKYDSEGRSMTINEQRRYMVELDGFKYQVKAGQNIIQRNYEDNQHWAPDFTPFWELYQQVEGALGGKNEFLVNDQVNYGGFPKHLMLPKGKRGGLPVSFFVTITPVGQHALGYPFDRYIEVTEFNVDNFFEKDMYVYHKLQDDINNDTHN